MEQKETSMALETESMNESKTFPNDIYNNSKTSIHKDKSRIENIPNPKENLKRKVLIKRQNQKLNHIILIMETAVIFLTDIFKGTKWWM